MTERLLEVSGLSAGYEGVPVVRDLDLHVELGEVVALLGANGAGKTTTLLAISGLAQRLGGSIDVLGGGVRFGAPYKVARRGLAHVPEDRSLFLQLTVEENLKVGVGRSRSAQRTRIEQALDLMPALRPLRRRRVGLLSGGEQQMLTLARALVGDPRILMIDEMSLGLAPVIVERLIPVVRRIADELGVGVLIVEQHIHLALGIADRAYVLRHGECVLSGSGAELSERRELVEASYLGDEALAELDPAEDTGNARR